MKIIIFIIIYSAFLVGCDYGVEWEDPPYEVHWVDISSNRTLARRIDGSSASIGRVEAKVIAVGSNERYVVAKQISPGTTSTSYYYVDKEMDGKHLNLDEITQGPFSEQAFNKLSHELGLPKFSKVF